MKQLLYRAKVDIKRSSIHGFGVFAAEKIALGAIVEEAPVLLSRYRVPEYRDYYFKWDADYVALPLGNSALLNHVDKPNCRYAVDYHERLLRVIAIKEIEKGEELTISYGTADWFNSRGIEKQTTLVKCKRFIIRYIPLCLLFFIFIMIFLYTRR